MAATPVRAGVATVATALLVGCGGPAADRGAPHRPAVPSPTQSALPAPAPTSAAAGAPAPRAVPARDAHQVARQIRYAEDAVADPAVADPDLRHAARVQQVAYRVLGTRPGWDAKVYALLPRRLHEVVRLNVAARREFRSMHYVLSDTLPAWRIVEPAPARDLMRFYREAEAAYGVGWEYLAAINLVETAMGRIRGTSVAGARGPMQFMPRTWARWGRGDVHDPADAVMAAARYLASNGFTRGPRGVAHALYEYNNHPAYVRGVTAYAKVMARRPRAFLAYHQWDVRYLTSLGDVVLPVGYQRSRPVPVRRYLAAHPQG